MGVKYPVAGDNVVDGVKGFGSNDVLLPLPETTNIPNLGERRGF